MKQDEFLPWHREQQFRVLEQHKADRLPHAILMGGPANVGKRHFAGSLAGYLLCRQPGETGRCKQCSTCHLFSAGTHPDFRWVQPIESKLIRIEQIRDLIDWASQTAQMGGMKIAVLAPAEQMNIQSANALLKSLEEPAQDTLLILVTSQPGRLLPTIRSRCQRLDFPLPKAEDTLAWLEDEIDADEDPELLLGVAGGAPLAVVERIDHEYLERRRTLMAAVEGLIEKEKSASEAVEGLASTNPSEVLEMLEGLFVDALKAQVTQSKEYLKNKDLWPLINKLVEIMEQDFLLDAIQQIGVERRAIQGPSNPNVQLLLEGLLIDIGKG